MKKRKSSSSQRRKINKRYSILRKYKPLEGTVSITSYLLWQLIKHHLLHLLLGRIKFISFLPFTNYLLPPLPPILIPTLPPPFLPIPILHTDLLLLLLKM